MSIKLTKTRAGNCTMQTWQGKVSIGCEKNDGDITVLPRYRKQVYDTIRLIQNNCANGLSDYCGIDSRGRKYYRLAPLYKTNYPNKILRFYSNNILEEDFDDIIELLQGIEIENKVSLDKQNLCNYNLFQLTTILTSMKRRKKVKQENGKLFINLEV
jgi:hypothetical protein